MLLALFQQNTASLWPRWPQIDLMGTYSKPLCADVHVLILETKESAKMLTISDLDPETTLMFVKVESSKQIPPKFSTVAHNFFPQPHQLTESYQNVPSRVL